MEMHFFFTQTKNGECDFSFKMTFKQTSDVMIKQVGFCHQCEKAEVGSNLSQNVGAPFTVLYLISLVLVPPVQVAKNELLKVGTYLLERSTVDKTARNNPWMPWFHNGLGLLYSNSSAISLACEHASNKQRTSPSHLSCGSLGIWVPYKSCFEILLRGGIRRHRDSWTVFSTCFSN